MNNIFKCIVFLTLFFSLNGCHFSKEEVYLTSNDVRWNYDGDTISFYCIAKYNCKNGSLVVRVKGVDTPEIKGKCLNEKRLAILAKQHTQSLLGSSSSSIVLVIDRFNQYDKYNRLLADVFVDNKNLASSLIWNELGKKYHGGRKEKWCDI